MGNLYIVSTPIGNLEDITIRAIRILFSVSAICCEDTRRTRSLLSELKKRYHAMFNISFTNTPQLIRCDEYEEKNVMPLVIDKLKMDQNVALVSDAGTPLISDPGYQLVYECRKRNIHVISIPGPTAFVAALSASGLPADTVCFFGYPPEKLGHRIKKFENILKMSKIHSLTAIFYASPHKLNEILSDMYHTFDSQHVVIVRELTKVYEEFISETLHDYQQQLPVVRKGEYVILIHLSQ